MRLRGGCHTARKKEEYERMGERVTKALGSQVTSQERRASRGKADLNPLLSTVSILQHQEMGVYTRSA